jgi:ribosomal-protein-alanine N-acetyltransferase
MVLEQHASTAAHWTQVEYERIFTLGQTPRVALVAEDARKIVGFLIARALGLDWEIENIAVDEAVRRRGFGATLVRDFLRLARTRGAACVFLEVRESNQAARKLYQKLGFVPCGRRKSYYNNPLEDAVVYRFHLSESG